MSLAAFSSAAFSGYDHTQPAVYPSLGVTPLPTASRIALCPGLSVPHAFHGADCWYSARSAGAAGLVSSPGFQVGLVPMNLPV